MTTGTEVPEAGPVVVGRCAGGRLGRAGGQEDVEVGCWRLETLLRATRAKATVRGTGVGLGPW